MERGARTTIRPYQPDDRDAVVRMLCDSTPWKQLGYTGSDWRKFFAASPPGRDSFVIESDGIVAGVALLRPNVLLGDYLELLAIAPEVQGHGLGAQLLGYLEELVFARAKNLFVCVSDFNKDARRFYEKHGYQELGPIPDLLITGSAEILMRKTTGPVRKS